MSEDARQDAVRRLLAESRGDEPMPPEVAQRLDTLLGQLVDARSQQDRVVSLAGRRRRQRARLLLVAAAAAAVIGVAGVVVPQLGGFGTGPDVGSEAAGATSDSESAADSGGSAADPGGSVSGGEAAPQDRTAPAAPEGPVVPAPDFAEGDVALIGVATAEADVASVVDEPGSPAFSSELALAGITCDAAAYGEGRLLPALYDAEPAVLAIRPPSDGVRTVDLLACGTAEVLRTITLPQS